MSPGHCPPPTCPDTPCPDTVRALSPQVTAVRALTSGHGRGHPSPRVRTVSARAYPHPLEVPMSLIPTTVGRPAVGTSRRHLERA